jgi:hypothetical protein
MGSLRDTVFMEKPMWSLSAVLFKVYPFHVLGQPVNIGIHGGGIDTEIMKAPLAFGETCTLNLDLE